MKKILFLLLISLMLNSCSWIHHILITNTTEKKWQVSYEINDRRGIFRSMVYLEGDRRTEGEYLNFPEGKVVFNILPNQTARLGWEPSTRYDFYKDEDQFDIYTTGHRFINIDSIHISNDSINYSIAANALDNYLKKNTRHSIVIDVGKVVAFYDYP